MIVAALAVAEQRSIISRRFNAHHMIVAVFGRRGATIDGSRAFQRPVLSRPGSITPRFDQRPVRSPPCVPVRSRSGFIRRWLNDSTTKMPDRWQGA
jgi:hypothetical protein